MLQSVPQMPVYFTRIRTSVSPISGTGTCWIVITSGFSTTAAFIVAAMMFLPLGSASGEQDVVPELVGILDHQGLQVGNGLGDAVVPAHGDILVLVAHHVVIADQGQLGDHLLPGHGAPARDAEAEPAPEALPVTLWDHPRTPDIVRDDLAILGVHVEDVPG